MKRIYTAFLLVLNIPKKLIRKVKIDNFVAGLIFGAIFSLVVNILTIQVQETIQKQRILEALENEIVNNMLQAKNTIVGNNKDIEKKSGISNFHTFQNYSRDLWEQSTEPLQYVAQLDQTTQGMIGVYYGITIPGYNVLQNKLNTLQDKLLTYCFDELGDNVVKDKIEECNRRYYNLLVMESGSAEIMFKENYDLLQQFHPTSDRLSDPFLKLIMGSKSTRILSGQ